MKNKFIILIFCLFILVGCSNREQNNNDDNKNDGNNDGGDVIPGTLTISLDKQTITF